MVFSFLFTVVGWFVVVIWIQRIAEDLGDAWIDLDRGFVVYFFGARSRIYITLYLILYLLQHTHC